MTYTFFYFFSKTVVTLIKTQNVIVLFFTSLPSLLPLSATKLILPPVPVLSPRVLSFFLSPHSYILRSGQVLLCPGPVPGGQWC